MNSEIEQFIQSVRRHNPAAKTWRSYASDLRLFASLTGEVSPTQVTPKDIDRFVNEQVERGFKPTTINRHLGTVVSLYRFLGLPCPVHAHRHRLREPQRLARQQAQPRGNVQLPAFPGSRTGADPAQGDCCTRSDSL